MYKTKEIVNKGVHLMEKEFIEQQKKKLIEQRNTILASLSSQSEEMKRLMGSSESGDEADVASDVIDRTLLDSLGAQDAQRLQLIDSTLERMNQGKYGLCLKCGKDIPQARLEAMPYAALCIECKSKEERRNR